MLELIGRLFSSIIPPQNADEDRLHSWRVLIAGLILMNVITLVFHIAWACGLLPGVSGFALSAEVSSKNEQLTAQMTRLQHAFTEQEIILLEGAILDMRSKQCAAIVNNNRESRRFAAERLTRLLNKYQETASHNFPLPPCAEM